MLSFLRKTCLYILLIPGAIWGLGFASNQAVLMANHDRFPVMWSEYKAAKYDKKLHDELKNKDRDVVEEARLAIWAFEEKGFLDDEHCLLTTKTHLNYLSDVISLQDTTYSIGDIMLYLGDWLWDFAPYIYVFATVYKLRRFQP